MTYTRSEDDEDESEDFEKLCGACEQRYTSRKAWQSHLKSRNHLSRADEKDSEIEVISQRKALPSSDMLNPDPSEESEPFDASRCLFCPIISPSLDANIEHMSHVHSFFIPNIENLIDVESFLDYLSKIISDFHECLYCGSEKVNRVAVQDHMRAKGHCRLEMEDDVLELREFYESSPESDGEDGEGGEGSCRRAEEAITITISADEVRLPSGKILRHRSSQPEQGRRRLSPARSPIPRGDIPRANLSPGSDHSAKPSEVVDRRMIPKPGTSTSLIGVPDQQQRALLATEKKMQTVDTRARKEYERKVERGGNRQKRFKVCSIGKKAGGLEKRNG